MSLVAYESSDESDRDDGAPEPRGLFSSLPAPKRSGPGIKAPAVPEQTRTKKSSEPVKITVPRISVTSVSEFILINVSVVKKNDDDDDESKCSDLVSLWKFWDLNVRNNINVLTFFLPSRTVCVHQVTLITTRDSFHLHQQSTSI